MSNFCFLCLSWSPESSSWAPSRQTWKHTTCSYVTSTRNCRSRWSTAKRSCRPLWPSSERCSSALSRNKWTDRGEERGHARTEANCVSVPSRLCYGFIWVRAGWKLTFKTCQTGLKSLHVCFFFFWFYIQHPWLAVWFQSRSEPPSLS